MRRILASVILVGGFVVPTASIRAQDDEPLPDPHVVFFPPVPPIYGAAIEAKAPLPARWISGRRLAAPGGMADFLGDDFYPALSTRLFVPALNKKLEARLQLYRAKRQQQTHALLNQLVGVEDMTPDDAERHLAAFAQL